MTGNVHRERTHDQSVKPREFRKQRVHHYGSDTLQSSLMEWNTLNSITNRMQPKELKGYNTIAIYRYKWRVSVQRTEWSSRVCPLPCDFCAMSVSVSLIAVPQTRELPHIYYRRRCDSNVCLVVVEYCVSIERVKTQKCRGRQPETFLLFDSREGPHNDYRRLCSPNEQDQQQLHQSLPWNGIALGIHYLPDQCGPTYVQMCNMKKSKMFQNRVT